VILLAGSVAEILARNWRVWLGAAIIIRLGVGLAQSILITYLSEIAPFQIRGFMIGAYQLNLAFGQLIVAVASQLLIIHQPTKWIPLVALEFVFSGVSLPIADRSIESDQSHICSCS
jgi:SP family general alpha glucoside:H+ symporter-like MFS transporter